MSVNGSCSTYAIRHPFPVSTTPEKYGRLSVSIFLQPQDDARICNIVLLPHPFRPTKPTFPFLGRKYVTSWSWYTEPPSCEHDKLKMEIAGCWGGDVPFCCTLLSSDFRCCKASRKLTSGFKVHKPFIDFVIYWQLLQVVKLSNSISLFLSFSLYIYRYSYTSKCND